MQSSPSRLSTFSMPDSNSEGSSGNQGKGRFSGISSITPPSPHIVFEKFSAGHLSVDALIFTLDSMTHTRGFNFERRLRQAEEFRIHIDQALRNDLIDSHIHARVIDALWNK